MLDACRLLVLVLAATGCAKATTSRPGGGLGDRDAASAEDVGLPVGEGEGEGGGEGEGEGEGGGEGEGEGGCRDACAAGERRCDGAGSAIERCAEEPAGCLAWVRQPCPEGLGCDEGDGQVVCRCDDACEVGEIGCAGLELERCVADPETGCARRQREACPAERPFCRDAAAGASCEADCPVPCQPGDMQCQGRDTVLRCRQQGDCWVLVPEPCADGDVCDEGGCAPACVDLDEDGYGDACDDGPDCDDRNDRVNPGAEEVCGDGVDQDCTGVADDPPGGCGECEPAAEGVCRVASCIGVRRCGPDRRWGPCGVDRSDEVCDGADNDCDGQTDESPGGAPGCSCGEARCAGGRWECPVDARLGEACDSGEPGPCRDGRLACERGGLSCEPNVRPGSLPERCNGADDDCDGRADEDDPEGGSGCATGQLGVCNSGREHCRDGRLRCEADRQAGAEVCGNGQDEDCDGQVDESPPCPGCAHDAGEVVEVGCVDNDTPRCSGRTDDWGTDCEVGLVRTTVTGAPSPAGDEDWYWMRGENGMCLMNFAVELLDIPAGSDWELCAWWTHDDGSDAEITCSPDTAAESVLNGSNWARFEGAQGCCSRRGGNQDEQVSLDGHMEDGMGLIKVWAFSGPSCDAYRVRYHF